jgi:hypothetical protein
MVGSCLLTQFALLCLLIGALRSFTFSVSIERFMVNSSHFYFTIIYFLPIPFLLICFCWPKGFILSYIFLSHSGFFFYV